MLKNHFIIAWRNIKKGKAYAALNILGLAVGMAVFILIMLFVRTELSYDRYHADAENIYRVIQEQPGNTYLGSNLFAVTAAPMAPAMVRDFPEVRTAIRINRSREDLIHIGGTPFIEKDIHWADPQIFDDLLLPACPRRPSHGPERPVLHPLFRTGGAAAFRRHGPRRPDDRLPGRGPGLRIQGHGSLSRHPREFPFFHGRPGPVRNHGQNPEAGPHPLGKQFLPYLCPSQGRRGPQSPGRQAPRVFREERGRQNQSPATARETAIFFNP